ncbi:PHP domain-containing protein, partial [Salmonella enterica subsp. enterica serovar Minnesota]|nr:PHP domain-containing protein [Salmonella enterica subsp. enterica serovar Minnesota]
PEQNDDDVSGSGAYTHMTLLSETTEGMHNLFRLSSRSSMEGYYFKPRMDRELLQTYGKGLIATTGCPSGEVQTRLRLGQYEA